MLKANETLEAIYRVVKTTAQLSYGDLLHTNANPEWQQTVADALVVLASTITSANEEAKNEKK